MPINYKLLYGNRENQTMARNKRPYIYLIQILMIEITYVL